MNTRPTGNDEASALASMFDAGTAPAHPWHSEELAAVLRHQLDAPVSVDLVNLRGVTAERVGRLAGAADPPIRSFFDLLGHPEPPVELLEMTKRFAKRARRKPGLGLPEEVAGVLYFGSILAARARRGTRISNLDEEELRDGVRWVLAQPWVGQATRTLFGQGLD
jgi:hypothetical protein